MKNKKINYKLVILGILVFALAYKSFNNFEEEKLTGETFRSSKGACGCPFSEIVENNCPTGKVSSNSCSRGSCSGVIGNKVYFSGCKFGGTEKKHKPKKCKIECPPAPEDYEKLNDCGNRIYDGDVDTGSCDNDVCLYEKKVNGVSEFKQYSCTGSGWISPPTIDPPNTGSGTITGMQVKEEGEEEKVCSCRCPTGFEVVIDYCDGSLTCDSTCTCKKEEGEGEEKKISAILRGCGKFSPFDSSKCKSCPDPANGWATLSECPFENGAQFCGACTHIELKSIHKTKKKIKSFSCSK